jgi:hypothetical protein
MNGRDFALISFLFLAGVVTIIALQRCAHAQEPDLDVALEVARACFLESGWSEPDCAAQFYVWKALGESRDDGAREVGPCNAGDMVRRARDSDLADSSISESTRAIAAEHTRFDAAGGVCGGDSGAIAGAVALYERGALRARNAHARLARALVWGDHAGWGEPDNRRWARLRAIALRLLAGDIPNPHPRARHFGSRVLRTDRERAARAIEQGRWRALPAKRGEVQAYYAERRRAR